MSGSEGNKSVSAANGASFLLTACVRYREICPEIYLQPPDKSAFTYLTSIFEKYIHLPETPSEWLTP